MGGLVIRRSRAAGIARAVAFLIAALLTPVAINLLHRITMVDRVEGLPDSWDRAMLMGGIALPFGIALGAAFTIWRLGHHVAGAGIVIGTLAYAGFLALMSLLWLGQIFPLR